MERACTSLHPDILRLRKNFPPWEKIYWGRRKNKKIFAEYKTEGRLIDEILLSGVSDEIYSDGKCLIHAVQIENCE